MIILIITTTNSYITAMEIEENPETRDLMEWNPYEFKYGKQKYSKSRGADKGNRSRRDAIFELSSISIMHSWCCVFAYLSTA